MLWFFSTLTYFTIIVKIRINESYLALSALSEIFLICSQLFQIQPYDPPELSQVKKGINIKVKKLQDTKGDNFSRNALIQKYLKK